MAQTPTRPRLSIVLRPHDLVPIDDLDCERLRPIGPGESCRQLEVDGNMPEMAQTAASEAGGEVVWIPDGARLATATIEEASEEARRSDVAAVVLTGVGVVPDDSRAEVTDLLALAPPSGLVFVARNAVDRVGPFAAELSAGWMIEWLIRAVERGADVRWMSRLPDLPAVDLPGLESLLESRPELVQDRFVELAARQERLLGRLLADNHDRVRRLHTELAPELAARRETDARIVAGGEWSRSTRADDLERELAARRHEVAALRGSLSWRLTAPLRWLGSWFVGPTRRS